MKKFKKVESIQIPEIDSVLSNTSQESKHFIKKSLEIVHQISLAIADKGKNQKYLADKLGKSEAEISKWLCGTHNFTVRTLANIGTALDQEIIVTPWKVKENHMKYVTEVYRANSNKKPIYEKPKQSTSFSLAKDKETGLKVA